MILSWLKQQLVDMLWKYYREYVKQKRQVTRFTCPLRACVFTVNLCERKGTASGLPGGSVGYSVCFTSATHQVSNAGLPGLGSESD